MSKMVTSNNIASCLFSFPFLHVSCLWYKKNYHMSVSRHKMLSAFFAISLSSHILLAFSFDLKCIQCLNSFISASIMVLLCHNHAVGAIYTSDGRWLGTGNWWQNLIWKWWDFNTVSDRSPNIKRFLLHTLFMLIIYSPSI